MKYRVREEALNISYDQSKMLYLLWWWEETGGMTRNRKVILLTQERIKSAKAFEKEDLELLATQWEDDDISPSPSP